MQTQILNTIKSVETISMKDLINKVDADEYSVWDAVIALLDAGQIEEVADEVVRAKTKEVVKAAKVVGICKVIVGDKAFKVLTYSNGDVEAVRSSRTMTVSARKAKVSAVDAAKACNEYGYHVDVDTLQRGQTATNKVEGYIVSVSRKI